MREPKINSEYQIQVLPVEHEANIEPILTVGSLSNNVTKSKIADHPKIVFLNLDTDENENENEEEEELCDVCENVLYYPFQDKFGIFYCSNCYTHCSYNDHVVTSEDLCCECDQCVSHCHCIACDYCGENCQDYCTGCNCCNSCECHCDPNEEEDENSDGQTAHVTAGHPTTNVHYPKEMFDATEMHIFGFNNEKCLSCPLSVDCVCGKCKEHCVQGHGSGMSPIPLWEERGIIISETNDDNPWFELLRNVGQDKIDIAQSMAEFYLLEYCVAALSYAKKGSLLYEESLYARDKQNELIEKLDQVFRVYVDMVVGGELRHHKAFRRNIRILTNERDRAWGRWAMIRRQVGPSALADAARMFREPGWSGSYGGPKWAFAAEILWMREVEKLAPKFFVDRVFTMQHNGGSLLNKVTWKVDNDIGMTIDGTTFVGQCHSATNPELGVLMLLASSEVNDIFKRWWRALNREANIYNKKMQILPDVWGWLKPSRFSWEEHMMIGKICDGSTVHVSTIHLKPDVKKRLQSLHKSQISVPY